jgi:glutamyl-tRNA synthetase
MASDVRVRFAPSPTGHLHVGGARTALFNWLFARHHGATFILRIEDTDLERSTQASIDQILDALKWLGLDWDEGPISQAARVAIHKTALEDMEAKGVVYRSYLTSEEQAERRDRVIARKQAFCFKRKLHDLSDEDTAIRAAAGAPYALRMDLGLEGEIGWDDQIRGRTSFRCADIEDFVVARSDGNPTYNFVCAYDDGDMAITHVIRGEDHISNTPKQIAVLQALGHPVPRYAHVSLILGADKARLSKRHGATSVQQFRDEGFLPEALVNFLVLLGWSFDDATEIFSRAQLVEHFSLERVNKAAAVCDLDKLRYLNGYYLRNQPKEKTLAEAKAVLRDAGLLDSPIYAERGDAWLESIIDLEIERSRVLGDFVENLRYFFEAPKDYDPKGVKKLFLQAGSALALGKLKSVLQNEDVEMTSEALDARLRQLAEDLQLSFGKLAQPVRLALTGRTASPGLYDVMIGLGREECARRVGAALTWIERERDKVESDTTY